MYSNDSSGSRTFKEAKEFLVSVLDALDNWSWRCSALQVSQTTAKREGMIKEDKTRH